MKPLDMEIDENDPRWYGLRKVLFAEHQEQYNTLPALVHERDGYVYTRWFLDDEDMKKIAETKVIELWCWTFGSALQPVNLRVLGVGEEDGEG